MNKSSLTSNVLFGNSTKISNNREVSLVLNYNFLEGNLIDRVNRGAEL